MDLRWERAGPDARLEGLGASDDAPNVARSEPSPSSAPAALGDELVT